MPDTPENPRPPVQTPTPTVDPIAALRQRFQAAADNAFPGADLPPVAVVPSANPNFGDAQCNSAMPFAKALGKPPREVAMALAQHVDLHGLAEPITEKSIAGPGFINITLTNAAIAQHLALLDTPSLTLDPDPHAPVTVVDLCGVNLAKQMHIGHLRSSVIGDTIARVLERLSGADKVIRQNHVGDWGLPIAMVTAELMRLQAAGSVNLDTLTLDDLDAIYKRAKAACETRDDDIAFVRAWGTGPKIEAELEAANHEPAANFANAKATLVRLQSGDADVRRVWQRLYDLTMAACLDTCRRLNATVLSKHSAGESSYEHALGPLVNELAASGAAVVDQGALVIHLKEAGIDEPCIIRKRDGGYLYATTDLAAIRLRTNPTTPDGTKGFNARRVVYCVDIRQSLHFKQVFAAARKAGLCPADATLEHAGFGTILGEDGRPFKSRSGETVKLAEVIDEAESAALAEVTQRYPDLPPDQQRAIAQTVAVAAIRYTDLSSERTKDYVFSFQRMVKAEGDTGPYLLYALARTYSLAAKAADQAIASGPVAIDHPSEKALAMLLLRYPETVRQVGQTLEPSRLCAHLYTTATAYAKFYADCPVLTAPAEQRASRLSLSALTNRVMADGLTLLGIPLLARM